MRKKYVLPTKISQICGKNTFSLQKIAQIGGKIPSRPPQKNITNMWKKYVLPPKNITNMRKKYVLPKK